MFTFKSNTAEQKDVENTKLADRKVLRPLSLPRFVLTVNVTDLL